MKIKFTPKMGMRAAALLIVLALFMLFPTPFKENSLHNLQVNQKDRSSSADELQESSSLTSLSSQSKSSSSSSEPSFSSGQSSNQVIAQPVSKSSISARNYVVGYYTSWSRHSGFTPDKIDASKVTHIHYAFADISSGLQLTMTDAYTDLKNLEGLRNLKKKNPALKIIISVGGWDNSKRFSDAALTSSSRETFAQSCLNFILKHGLDGVDLDWEYPVSGGVAGTVHRPQDKQNYTKLISAIRQKLNVQTARDGKRYFLTITGAPDKAFTNNTEPALFSSVDYLFIMAYDMNGPWDQYTGFNAPLYPSDAGNRISVSQGIKNYLNAGASPKKLVLGMPFYGYSYEVSGVSNSGLNSTFTAAKSVGYDMVVSKFLNNSAYSTYYDNASMVPYLFGNNTFVTYENSKSIAQKAKLAKEYGLAGVGAWELAFDKSGILLSSAYKAFQ
ncbi:MAG: hypothetical protein K0Q85_1302 [Caproiciproducens sp.]|nr:hypothetical protein [Caproiciproducens sp.]